MPLGMLAAVEVGAVFGLVNGYLVAGLNIPPFVATLGTLGMSQGLALIASDGQSVVGIPRSVSEVYLAAPFGLPLPIIIAVSPISSFTVSSTIRVSAPTSSRSAEIARRSLTRACRLPNS